MVSEFIAKNASFLLVLSLMFVTFNLSRHIKYRAQPHYHCPILRHFEKSPQIPTGYPGMMVLALFHPLLKLIIHKNGHSIKK